MFLRFQSIVSFSIVASPIVAALLCVTSVFAEPTAAQQDQLKKNVIPAYDAGDTARLAKAVQRLAASLDVADIQELDGYLKTLERPGLGQLLLNVRAAQVRRGGSFGKPKPTPTEAMLIAPVIIREAARVRKEVAAMPVMSPSEVKVAKLSDFAYYLDSIADAQLTAGASADIVRQSVALAALLQSKRIPLDEFEREELVEAWQRTDIVLATLHGETQEREIELRMRRLARAVQVLRGAADLKERLVAAHCVDYDGTWLTALFATRTPMKPFLNPQLNDSELPERIQQQVAEGEQLAGDLIEKSRLLFAGLHWWLRARYGFSSDFLGLVKPKTRALQTNMNLVQMPAELPQQSDKDQQAQYPERRHHYTWAWEERTVQVASQTIATPAKTPVAPPVIPSRKYKVVRIPIYGSRVSFVPVRSRGARTIGGWQAGGAGRGGYGGGSRGSGFGSRGGAAINISPGRQYGPINRPKSWTVNDVYRKLGYEPPKRQPQKRKTPQGQGRGRVRSPLRAPPQPQYIERFVPRQDPNLVFRLVGFVEYQKALECFDQLTDQCNALELQAIDELISEREELTIETNLVRKIPHPPSSLETRPGLVGDDFKRRGFKWITALARSELAAMQVGFSAHDNAVGRRASAEDLDEYRKLIRDAACMHYFTLENDGDMQLALMGKATPNRVLAFYRRLLIAGGLIRGTAMLDKDVLTAKQRAELTAWLAKVDKTMAALAKQIESYHSVEIRNSE